MQRTVLRGNTQLWSPLRFACLRTYTTISSNPSDYVLPKMTTPEAVYDYLHELFHTKGTEPYFQEPVSHLEHALQVYIHTYDYCIDKLL